MLDVGQMYWEVVLLWLLMMLLASCAQRPGRSPTMHRIGKNYPGRVTQPRMSVVEAEDPFSNSPSVGFWSFPS